MASTVTLDNQNYDRLAEAKRFDDSKLGVKGLIDSGVTSIPRLFIHPSHTLTDLKPTSRDLIPAIDLSGVYSDRRPVIVEQLSRASRELGFFQIVNHGIPKEVLDRIITGMKAFHEQPTEIKKQWYSRGVGTGVSYLSNIDLFRAKAASWRDTLQVKLGPELAPLENIPEICRKEVVEWNEQATKVAEMLMELLSEGLGLASGKLKEMSCLDAKLMAAHYYPPCPQPDLTFGITSHTDPGVVTVLLQDHIGGLHVKHGDEWVDVKPIPGALVINIGDILQILSNDEYTSVDHRVVANPSSEARQSVAIFFNPGKRDCMYGPIPELVSPEKPARYRQFSLVDYMGRFFSKELDGKTLTNYYRV